MKQGKTNVQRRRLAYWAVSLIFLAVIAYLILAWYGGILADTFDPSNPVGATSADQRLAFEQSKLVIEVFIGVILASGAAIAILSRL